MRWTTTFLRAFRITEFRPDPERDVREELEHYLELRTRELMEQGMGPQEARKLALERFGDRDRIEEECRRIRELEIRDREREHLMDTLIRDVRFAVRGLVNRPLFSAVVVGMLALGIGGNAAIFSVVDALFLTPLASRDGGEIVDLEAEAPQWNLERVGITYPDFLAWREHNETFGSMGVWTQGAANMVDPEGAERVGLVDASHDLLDVLGYRPVVGRLFTQEEDRPGGARVVLLLHGFWQERFGGDRSIIGTTITLDEEPWRIIGVLPDDAMFSTETRLWRPLREEATERESYYLAGLGQLLPGVTRAQGQQDLRRVQEGLIEAEEAPEEVMPIVNDLEEELMGDLRMPVYALWGGVIVLLLIACINASSLLLARAHTRRREYGVRTALGASSSQIVRQALTEVLVYAFLGGLIGLGLGWLGMRGLEYVLPVGLPTVGFGLDGGVLLYVLGICLVSALLAGLIPALRSVSSQPRDQLSDGGRTASARGSHRLLGILVSGEVALALALLAVVGLLVSTYTNIRRIDPGFESRGALTFRIQLPEAAYPDSAQVLGFYDRLLERLGSLPGVEGSAGTTILPMQGHSGFFFEARDAEPRPEGSVDPVTLVRLSTAGYGEVMGIRMESGSWFDDTSGRQGHPVTLVVNQTFARHHWGDENPVGRYIRTRGGGEWWEVVGVCHDTRHYGLDTEMRPGVFGPVPVAPPSGLSLVLRTGGDPTALAPMVREAVSELDPHLPVYGVTTLEEIVRESMGLRRSYSMLLLVFAALALLLSLSGLYGVITYTVNARNHEMGIRAALGASRPELARMVVSQAMVLVGVGALVGLVLSVGAGELLSSLLYGVSAAEPMVLVAAAAALGLLALGTTLIPAFRAARTDPVKALRIEQ